MTEGGAYMTGGVARADLSEFECGGVTVRPLERVVSSARASVAVEPLVMRVLVTLAGRAGQLVSREKIFEDCWGSSAVGDDSLNRVVAALRRALQQVSGETLKIETVPGAGYVLRLAEDRNGSPIANTDVEMRGAIEAAIDSWRFAFPEPDYLCIERLRRACAIDPANARAWGMLALLCRHAAEYGEPSVASAFVRECEKAARKATELDPQQPEARTALVSIIPLFGRWSEARRGLQSIIEAHPTNAVALQDLATLEMATGCVRASKRLRDALVAQDPLCACYCYKSVYQHWSVGDLRGMDAVADRAFSLWPTHPAVWNVRLWTFAYTDRVAAALAMLEKDAPKPVVPAAMLRFLNALFTALADGNPASVDRAVSSCKQFAGSGPGSAMAALFGFGLLGDADSAFEVVNAYYLRDGSNVVPLRHTASEMSLNEHHRRLTQVLFTPVFAAFRDDGRFMSICDRVGLTHYWADVGLTPDFLQRDQSQ